MSIHKKLLEIQKEMPRIDKDSTNPHFKNKYATLANVLSIVLPLLNKHGIYQTNTQLHSDAGWVILIKLVDAESGESIETTLPLLNTQDMQKMGSSITYAHRYGLLPLLGIAPEMDDDGNNTQNNKNIEVNEKEISEKIELNKQIMLIYNNHSDKLRLVDEKKAETIALGVASNHKDVSILAMRGRLTWMNDTIKQDI